MAVDTTIALITLADAKVYLKIATGTTSEDSIVSDLINECSVWINSYCGRALVDPTVGGTVGASYTEYYDGDGTSQLYLKNWPLIALTSLYEDYARAWTADTAIDVAANVQLDSASGILTLWNTRVYFARGVGNVRVIYRAGYVHNVNVPYDLQMAARKLVAWKYFQDYSQRRFGVASESVQDRTTNYTDEALLPDVKQILDRYRRIGV